MWSSVQSFGVRASCSSWDRRTNMPPAELASYCLHALNAAAALLSEAAVGRLVTITLAGLRPRHESHPASQAARE